MEPTLITKDEEQCLEASVRLRFAKAQPYTLTLRCRFSR